MAAKTAVSNQVILFPKTKGGATNKRGQTNYFVLYLTACHAQFNFFLLRVRIL
jgi:hypothetical protein